MIESDDGHRQGYNYFNIIFNCLFPEMHKLALSCVCCVQVIIGTFCVYNNYTSAG